MARTSREYKEFFRIDGAAEIDSCEGSQSANRELSLTYRLEESTEQQGGQTKERGAHKLREKRNKGNEPSNRVQQHMQQPPLTDHVPGAVTVEVKISGNIINADGLVGNGKAIAQNRYKQGSKDQYPVLQHIPKIICFLYIFLHFMPRRIFIQYTIRERKKQGGTFVFYPITFSSVHFGISVLY